MVNAEYFRHEGKRWLRIPETPLRRFCMGVDLGQSQDYTAIAVLEILQPLQPIPRHAV